MNTSILQRLGFLFTLLCLTAVAAHPGAAAAAAAAHGASAHDARRTSTAAPAKDDRGVGSRAGRFERR